MRGLVNRPIAGLAIVGNAARIQNLTGFPIDFNVFANANLTGEFHISCVLGITGRSDGTLGLGGPRVERNAIQNFIFATRLRLTEPFVLGGAIEGVVVGTMQVFSQPVNPQGTPTGAPKVQGTITLYLARGAESGSGENRRSLAGYLLTYTPASNSDQDKDVQRHCDPVHQLHGQRLGDRRDGRLRPEGTGHRPVEHPSEHHEQHRPEPSVHLGCRLDADEQPR